MKQLAIGASEPHVITTEIQLVNTPPQSLAATPPTDDLPQLNPEESARRDFILNGNILQVVWRIGLPIALFQLLGTGFRLVDSFMAASISASAVSMVSYFGQINLILNGLGLGLATGASLKISQAYGAGNYAQVKKQISSLIALTLVICLALIAIVVPFGVPLLRLIGTPDDFITGGITFFYIEFFSTLVMFFNSIYIAIERSQGNSKRIFSLNLIVMLIKLTLTAIAVYVLQAGIAFLALSTLISQLVLLVIAFRNLHSKSEVFRFSLGEVSFRSGLLWPMVLVSIPIMVERSAFASGKVVVNSMIIGLGPLVVGALGISNLISGAATSPMGGMQDATINVIAQNRGAQNVRRCFNAFKAVLALNLGFATVVFVAMYVFAHIITSWFAPGDPAFHQLLFVTYRYEILGHLPLAIASAVTALLIGFGYTKLTLLLNVCRVFVFRIPVLWYLQNFTQVGADAAGIVMAVSNILVGVLAVVLALIVIKRVSSETQTPFWYLPQAFLNRTSLGKKESALQV